MDQEPRYVGIDVAKAQVDVAVCSTGQRWHVSYEEAGIRELVSQMETLGPTMVGLEASGGLELPLVAALAAASLPMVVVNPRQVRDFARAVGKLAKTDALDVQVLAHFAEAVRPAVRSLRDAKTQALNSLVTRRYQVIAMLVSEKNRLGTATSAVRPRIQAHIAWRSRRWSTWIRTWGRPSARALSGERRTTSCAQSPAWDSSSPSLFWPTCRNWVPWTAGRSLPLLG